ncbi:MAG: hypothetical protein R3F49_10650 [Planctomycetota bacterium]
MRTFTPVTALLALAPAAAAAPIQGLNVDLGANILFAPAPSASYGAASGQQGVWNPFPPALVPTPLLDLSGGSAGVTLFSDSSSSFTVFPSAMAPGEDQRLMEDFQITPNLNTLVTWTLEGLYDGPYTLFVYASDPTNAALQVEVGVPASGAPNQVVGGGWPGMHVPGVTFATFTVGVLGGTLEFTAEVVGGQLDSGVVNGFQLVPITVPPLGFTYCSSNPNSTGNVGFLGVSGSASVQDDLLRIEASELPPNAFAFVLASLTQGQVLNPGGSQGVLCLGGAIGRFNSLVGAADGAGFYSICTQGCPANRTFSLAAIPQPNGAIAAQPGDTWSFQAWYRDTSPGGAATSNFTSGFQLTFQ